MIPIGVAYKMLLFFFFFFFFFCLFLFCFVCFFLLFFLFVYFCLFLFPLTIQIVLLRRHFNDVIIGKKLLIPVWSWKPEQETLHKYLIKCEENNTQYKFISQMIIWNQNEQTERSGHMTFIQRHDVASTLRRRCIDVMCLPGKQQKTFSHSQVSKNPGLLLFIQGRIQEDFWGVDLIIFTLGIRSDRPEQTMYIETKCHRTRRLIRVYSVWPTPSNLAHIHR